MSVYLTWRELAEAIAAMPEDRRDDPVQVWPDRHDEPIGLHGVYEVGTVAQYSAFTGGGFVPTRSLLDNAHHPEHFVLIADGNPSSPEGDQWYEVTEDGLVGNRTSELIEIGDGS